MNYPIHILPKLNYKLIECDLAEYYLIRHFDLIDNSSDLFDVLGQLQDKYLFDPTHGYNDLSCSLLGIFTHNDILVKLTEKGILTFGGYCNGDYDITTPIYNEDFTFVPTESRKFWIIRIGDINSEVLNFEEANTKIVRKIQCIVLHTPAKWNFWHLSIRWLFEDGEFYFEKKRDKTITNGNIRRVAAAARVLLKSKLLVSLPDDIKVIDEANYKTA